MEELKRMLEVIHKENKTILSLICSDDIDSNKEFEEISNEIDEMYDGLFYGIEETR